MAKISHLCFVELSNAEDLRQLIKGEMRRRGISLKKLSKDAGFTRSALRRFLEGDGTISTNSLFLILGALGVELTASGPSRREPQDMKMAIADAFVMVIDEYRADKSPNRRPLDAAMIRELSEKAARIAIKKSEDPNQL